MINERIQNYINDHTFCHEYLFRDWDSFLNLLFAEGGRISLKDRARAQSSGNIESR